MIRLVHTYGKAVAFVLTVTCCNSVHAKSPEKIEGTTLISAEELITLANEKPELVLIDSRVSANRKHGYIEGSVSLPDTDTTCKSLEKTIPDKTTPAAFYCNGIKCGRSAKAARVAVDCGYTNVYWFRGGFEEWKAKNFPYLHQE